MPTLETEALIVESPPVQARTKPSSFLSNLSTVLGAQITCAMISLALEIVYARLLGPDGRGQISLCLMAIAAAVLVGSLGGEIPITIWAADTKKKSFDWLSAVCILGLLGSIVASALWAAIYWLWNPAFLRGITPNLAILVLVSIPLSIASAYGIALITGGERFKGRAGALIADQAGNLIAVIFLVGLYRRSAEMGVFSNFIGLLAATGLVLFLARKTIANAWNPSAIRRHLTAAFSLGVRAQFGNLATFFNYRLDVFIVNYFLNPAQVGLYTVGVLVSESLWQIPHAVAVSLLPRTARTADGANSIPFTCAVIRHVFLLALVSGLALAVLSPWLVPMIFGARFSASVVVIWWILPGTITLAVGKVIGADLAARGKPEYSSIFALVALIVTVILDFVLIPRRGIEGAALASSAAYLVDTILIAAALKRELRVKWRTLLFPSLADFAVYYQAWNKLRAFATSA